MALPGSVLDNAQSPELRTYLAGQIARACVVFGVDEIVVFDEQGEQVKYVEPIDPMLSVSQKVRRFKGTEVVFLLSSGPQEH